VIIRLTASNTRKQCLQSGIAAGAANWRNFTRTASCQRPNLYNNWELS